MKRSNEIDLQNLIIRIKKHVMSSSIPISIEANLRCSLDGLDNLPICTYSICVYKGGEVLVETIQLFESGDAIGSQYVQRLHMQMTIHFVNYIVEILSFQLLNTPYKMRKEIKMEKEINYLKIPEGFIIRHN
ncbi:hypothetical protein [Bacillus cereus group sp. Sample62]|uniref:hypothetical protein n=1 Tax=Bacillus cereus group sp. Sample62 TaxID=2816447 RepID=UPI002FDC36DB